MYAANFIATQSCCDNPLKSKNTIHVFLDSQWIKQHLRVFCLLSNLTIYISDFFYDNQSLKDS